MKIGKERKKVLKMKRKCRENDRMRLLWESKERVERTSNEERMKN